MKQIGIQLKSVEEGLCMISFLGAFTFEIAYGAYLKQDMIMRLAGVGCCCIASLATYDIAKVL